MSKIQLLLCYIYKDYYQIFETSAESDGSLDTMTANFLTAYQDIYTLVFYIGLFCIAISTMTLAIVFITNPKGTVLSEAKNKVAKVAVGGIFFFSVVSIVSMVKGISINF